MTSTTNESMTHETPLRAGRLTVATVPDVGTRWVYVVAPLPGRDVFGVDMGNNSSYIADLPDGPRWVHATIAAGDSDYPVTRLTGEVLAALVTFLGAAGIADPTAAEVAPTAPDDDAIARARREGAAEVQRRWDEWNEFATRVAHQYADNNNLCREFDRCMEEIGLEPRGRDYVVTVTYRVTARNADDAEELVASGVVEFDDMDVEEA